VQIGVFDKADTFVAGELTTTKAESLAVPQVLATVK
jgi:hypothetical protein